MRDLQVYNPIITTDVALLTAKQTDLDNNESQIIILKL